MMESDIQAFMLANSAIVAKVVSRIFVGQAPLSTPYPFITINMISKAIEQDHDVYRSRIQFTTYADSPASADEVIGLIVKLFLRYMGTMIKTQVVDVAYDSTSYFFESSTKKHIMAMDLFFRYRN